MTLPRAVTALAAAAALALPGSAALGQSNSELDERLERIERRLESSALIDLMNSSEALRREVSTLRGDIEVLRREVESLKERQREIYVDVDDRLRELETADEGGGASADDDNGEEDSDDEDEREDTATDDTEREPGDEASDAAADAGDDDEEDAASPAEGESEAYQAAFDTLRDGRYDQAAEEFERFLDEYPEGSLAANARYWLGESRYVVREFDTALEHFQQVLDDYPDSNKRPDAMLKIGFVHFEEERTEEAREALQRVVEEYPDSTAANLAEQRLEQL